ncbi:MAG TPA: hypothetical protein VGH33_11710 [Isosphaeraceae bacterium]
MPLLFAHHDMLDGLDFLRLNPTTPGEHAFAFAVYALLLVGVVNVARFGWGGCRKALASRTSRAVGLAEPRS